MGWVRKEVERTAIIKCLYQAAIRLAHLCRFVFPDYFEKISSIGEKRGLRQR